MEKKIIYKGTQIFLRHELYGLVHTAGTEEPLPRGVKLSDIQAKAREFGVEIAGDEIEYGLQVKAKTEDEARIAVERIRRFLDYSEANWKINWW
jgi:hypothetical protein